MALEEREPVGILTVVPSWGYRKGTIIFLTIFVQPEFHGRGIGRRLIEAGEEYGAAKRGQEDYHSLFVDGARVLLIKWGIPMPKVHPTRKGTM